jgi:hypothetical protein
MDKVSVGAFGYARDLFEACVPESRQEVTDFPGHRFAWLFREFNRF